MGWNPQPRYDEKNDQWRIGWKGRRLILCTGRDNEHLAWTEAFRLTDGQIVRPGQGSNEGPLAIAQMIERWLAENYFAEDSTQANWLKLWSDVDGRRKLADLGPKYLEGWRDWLTRKYHLSKEVKEHEVRSTHYGKPLSPTTIRHYVMAAWRVIRYAKEKGWLRQPNPPLLCTLPRARKGHKDIPLDVLQAAMSKLENPTINTWTCPKCNATIPARGKGPHSRRCTGPGYQPSYSRERQTEYRLARTGGKKSHRVLPLCKLALFTGLRPDEACKLHWSEIDLPGKKIVLPETRTKTGESTGTAQTVPLTIEAQELLAAIPNKTGYVFLSRLGKPYTPDGMRSILRPLGIKGGYALRHTFAQWALSQGFPLEMVGKWLRHTDLDTTRIYCEVRDPQAIQAAQSLTSPLLRKPSDPYQPLRIVEGDHPGPGPQARPPIPGESGSDHRAVAG